MENEFEKEDNSTKKPNRNKNLTDSLNSLKIKNKTKLEIKNPKKLNKNNTLDNDKNKNKNKTLVNLAQIKKQPEKTFENLINEVEKDKLYFQGWIKYIYYQENSSQKKPKTFQINNEYFYENSILKNNIRNKYSKFLNKTDEVK